MSYSDVIKICTLWHKLAQYRTKLHKVAQKKWKFSMINVKITNLWDCKTYRWTIFNTRCVLDDSRSNTFLCLSSPHFFYTTFSLSLLWSLSLFFSLGNIFNTSLQTLVQYHHLFQFSTHHWHWMMVDQGCSYDDRGSSFRDRGRSSFAAFALDLFLQSPSVKSLNTQFWCHKNTTISCVV